MTWTDRVVWQEGMFLRAQHFQQHDRWVEALLRRRTAFLRPYPWGLAAYAINRDLLANGRFALASATGVFEDGAPFIMPDETALPPPLEAPANARDAIVYLAMPILQAGAAEIAADEAGEGRYGVRGFEVYDTHSGSPQPAELQLGGLRLRYLLEGEDRAGYFCIGLARIVEVAADRRITLDDGWIPPAMICAATPPLAGFIAELTGMINQRAEAIAQRMGGAGGGVAESQDVMLLQAMNRWHKLLAHWAQSGLVHPEEFYATLLQMVGEFATFTEPKRRPAAYLPYRHEDLQRSFAPVVADLRRSLTTVLDPGGVQIALEARPNGVWLGMIVDRSVLRNTMFVLVVQADIPSEQLRRLFPAQVKIGAREHIRQLVLVAMPGIAVRPMPTAPRQIHFYANASYFELDRNSAHWQEMQNSAAFALHVSGEFPGLRMELWAIRGSGGT